jgi:hypothetical protein
MTVALEDILGGAVGPYIQAAVAALVNSSPTTLDTLKELATAVGNDANFSATMATTLATKAPLASPAFTGSPTASTQALGTNNTALATTAFVSAALATLVNSSPATLDTLNELATALGNDPNFATTMATNLASKAPLSNPSFTGTPTAPTAPLSTNTTAIATTAFVQASAVASRKLIKLLDAVNSSKIANPYDLPELGGVTTAPTGSQVQITFPTTAPTGGWFYPAASGGAPNVDNWCNFYATPKVFGGLADHVQFQNGTTSAASAAAGATIQQTVSGTTSYAAAFGTWNALEFFTDDLNPCLKMIAGGGNPYFRLIVDGQYVTKARGALTTIPSNRFVQMTFATRKLRRIRLEVDIDTAFDGLYLTKTAMVKKVRGDQLVRAALLLDSYGVTTNGASFIWDGPLAVMTKLLGWDDIRNSSIAGTGWVNPGAAWPFGSHMIDTQVGADVIILGGPFNDNGYPAASITTNALAGYQQCRTLNPGVPIFCLGSYTPPGANLAACQTAENAVLSSFNTWADPLSISFSLRRYSLALVTIRP